jgi:hypothetical protein
MKTQRLTCLIAMTAALALASTTAPAMADLAPPPAPEGTPEAPAAAPEAPPATPDAGAEAAPAAAPDAATEAAPAAEPAPAEPASTEATAEQLPAEEEKKGGIGMAFWIAILAVFVALGAAYVGTRGKKAE